MIFTKPSWIGPSKDRRTSRWAIECPSCGASFEPRTTMLNIDSLECPKLKCRAAIDVDYNAQIAKLATPPGDG